MQLWQDGLVAVLAAIGLASLMWSVVKAVLYGPRQEKRQGAVALIPAKGDGEHLEEQVRSLGVLRREQGIFGPVLLVDCGLTEEGRKLCALLEKKDRFVSVCTREEVPGYLG